MLEESHFYFHKATDLVGLSTKLRDIMQSLKIPIATLCLAIMLTGCGEQPAQPVGQPVRPVRAMKVGDVAGINSASFPGRAKAAEEVNLSFRVSGELVSLPIEVGKVVKKGDVLATLDQRDFKATVDSAEANMQRAIAQLDALQIARPEEIRRQEAQVRESEAVLALAETDYQRVLDLQKEDPGAVAQADVDRKKGARDRSSAVLDQAKESLGIAREGARPEDIRAQEAEIKSLESIVVKAKNDLEYTELVAPFDGTIAATYAENYQTVSAGRMICRLLDTSKIEIVIDIPESKIALARYVTDIVCVFDAFPNVPIEGAIVKEIGTEASETTRTYPVTLLMDQPDASTGAKILPGMAGRVRGTARLTEEVEKIGFAIPESAIFEGDDGRKYVWLIDENTMTAYRSEPITPGELTSVGVRVKEIEAGQWVVTAGVHYLEEGQEVRILAEPTTTTAAGGSPTSTPVTQEPATEEAK